MPKKICMLFVCILILSSLTFACNRGGKTEKKTKETATTAVREHFIKENKEDYANIKDTIGMPVYMPDLDLLADIYQPYLPARLRKEDNKTGMIERATKIKETSVNPAYYEVDYQKGLSVYGSSNPDFNTDADFTGEFDLGGKHFEEHSYKNNPTSYQLLWRTSSATFMVSVNLKNGLTKDEVKKIAGSLKPVP